MNRVVLISCSGKKESVRCAARDLYLPSDLFAKSRAFAEHLRLDYAILSAKHGLLQPSRVIAPYNERLGGKRDRGRWAEKVLKQLRRDFDLGDTVFVLLAGRQYTDELVASGELRTEDPLRGLGIGHRKQWLKEFVETTP